MTGLPVPEELDNPAHFVFRPSTREPHETRRSGGMNNMSLRPSNCSALESESRESLSRLCGTKCAPGSWPCQPVMTSTDGPASRNK
jgi:hypothetical protein